MFEPTIATFRAVGQLTCQAALMFKEVDFLNASVVSDVHNAPLDTIVLHARKTAQRLRYRPPLSALCLTILAALILWLGTMPSRAIASIAGEVVFAVGKATVLPREVPLQRGLSLHEGDVIVTEAGAHVHVRFADGALLSVRPNSRLSIERYSYRPGQPAENAVKFRLESGTARSITGKAGEEAKDRFRLNTPVAAIGVRGTDFVVATDAASSAVAVNSGAIVVSPIGGTCAREALGPCAGSLAKELSASMSGMLAVVDSVKVELMAIKEMQKGRFPPPSDVEPKSSVSAPLAPAASTSVTTTGATAMTVNSSTTSVVAPNVPSIPPISSIGASTVTTSAMLSLTGGLSNTATNQPVFRREDLDIRQLESFSASLISQIALTTEREKSKSDQLSPSTLTWGRWANTLVLGDGDPAPIIRNPEYSRLVISDGVHALFGSQGSRWSGAREGLFDFKLRDAKVYLNDATGFLSMGTVTSGSLTIDLAAGRFETKLIGTHQQFQGAIEVNAKGSMTEGGIFYSSASSAARVTGVLANEGREAAYSFNRPVTLVGGVNANFSGLTRWGR